MKFSVLFFVFVSLVFSGPMMVHADQVRLKIVDERGKAVVGASVKVAELTGNLKPRKEETPLAFLSNANGMVVFNSRITAQKADQSTPRTPPSAVVRVLAKDFAMAAQDLKAGINTITLRKAVPFGGTVLSANRKPVAGAKIVLYSFTPPNPDAKTCLFPTTLQLVVVSDANGKWKFSKLPSTGKVGIAFVDKRFMTEGLQLDLAKPVPPLFLQTGATVKGRMLTPAGKGAARVRFYAGDINNQPTTKDDGTFVVSGLKPGEYYFQVVGGNQKLPFIVPFKKVSDLKAGETRDIGKWQTLAGDAIKGRVVDATTKKPIANASILLWGEDRIQGSTNANGEFSLLISSATSNITITASGFKLWQQGRLSAVKKGWLDLGTIELKSGVNVQVLLKNEVGKVVENVQIYADSSRDIRQYAKPREDGTFQFEALEAGEYKLGVSGAQLVSDGKFTVAPDQKKVLEFVVEGQQSESTPQKVVGIVVDQDRKPVAGAKIELQMLNSGPGQSAYLVSGIDGTFTVNFTVKDATPEVASVKHPDFVLAKADFQIDGVQWRGEISLQKRGLALRGRVVGINKEGVPRAFVGLEDGFGLPVMTNESGDFSLPDVPLQDVTLLASSGANLAAFPVGKTGENIEIVLPKASGVQNRVAIADELLQNSRLSFNWESRWDTLGSERIEAAILRSRSEANRGWPYTWNIYLEELVEREPERFLARQVQLLEATPPANRAIFEMLLMRARAQSKNENEREIASKWLETQQQIRRELDTKNLDDLLNLALIQARLGRTENNLWLDYAVQLAAPLGKTPQPNAYNWGVKAAKISAQATEYLGEDWSPINQMVLWQGAIATFSTLNDGPSLKLAYEKMKVLLEAVKKTPEVNTGRPDAFRPRPDDLFNQSRDAYAKFLAKSDPKAAMAMIASTSIYNRAQILLAIGKSAAQRGQMPLARQAWSKVLETQSSNLDLGSQAALDALEFDPQFADQLFKKAYAKSIPQPNATLASYYPSIVAYARARAKNWPGESRILLEREWKKRVEYEKTILPTNFSPNGQKMRELAGAMAMIDVPHAIEMSDLVKEEQNLRAETKTDIAIELLKK